ncbi:MAG: hypothetical protein OXE50_16065 [Chloroflexi bacterium]|nr:hypothetical protein [Chloroflexota bacterium]
MPYDLKTDDGLRLACNAAEKKRDTVWTEELTEFLINIQNPSDEQFESEEFQQLLWKDTHNKVTKARQAEKVRDDVIANPKFRRWFLEQYLTIHSEVNDRSAKLLELHDGVINHLTKNHGSPRRPEFAVFRAIAALFPTDFTTLSHEYIRDLAKKKFDLQSTNIVECHRNVLQRLEDVLGPINAENPAEVARRMTLPWMLKELIESEPHPEPQPNKKPNRRKTDGMEIPSITEITDRIDATDYYFPSDLYRNLHLGLWADKRRHFAILTGISGSGKTALAREYGKAVIGSNDSEQYLCVTAVQPGWTDPSYLLGYANPLKDRVYEQTSFLELLLHAADNPSACHVAVLDEMNLSHPEQYLAPILSAMETGDYVELHGHGDKFDDVPARIPYPGNFVLIGTVNMDETTMGLSDKVLDRAWTLEFWDIDVDAWPGWRNSSLPDEDAETVGNTLIALMNALKPARLHFGYRTIKEVATFVEQCGKLAPDWPLTEALDRAVYAKVLPKLRGDDSGRVRRAFESSQRELKRLNLSESSAKVAELIEDLDTMGSARFWR